MHTCSVHSAAVAMSSGVPQAAAVLMRPALVLLGLIITLEGSCEERGGERLINKTITQKER